jgi:rubrerythrin
MTSSTTKGDFIMDTTVNGGRRKLLRVSGASLLSATAVALLAGCERMAGQAQAQTNPAGDVQILNVALGLEHEAISAYSIAAGSGLVTKAVLPVAVTFQSHHKEHRDALIATIRKLGGSPVAAKPDAEVAKALNASSLKNQTDVLRLAQKLERGAAYAYLGVIPSFSDKGLSQVSAKLASDETGHWMVLSQALGDAISPKAFYVG